MGPLGGFDLPSMLPMLGGLNSMNLCGANGCGVGSLDQSSLCGGSVTISLPSIGNLDKIDGALSVFQAVKCTVYELPGSPLAELHKVVGCALVNALRAAESANADLRMVLYAFESAVRNTLDLQNFDLEAVQVPVLSEDGLKACAEDKKASAALITAI
ncbi:hypothetical protein HPB50_005750 [Hyalomma asiaticum]|uniref:Uncharacterized protein n=1 Tax=Hyalomma asiaticum TaxID=266040 RepID=A0ACB7SNA3_HYAAI|nr:hypothetical protein HPB50_005750 [Hyalomma asiaticum]